MIETIPNPLCDKGVQKDIADKVADLMSRNAAGNYRNITQQIENLIHTAASWGMSEGFRMGWRICEMRNKKNVRL